MSLTDIARQRSIGTGTETNPLKLIPPFEKAFYWAFSRTNIYPGAPGNSVTPAVHSEQISSDSPSHEHRSGFLNLGTTDI
jgi:hypothetical protein